MLKFLEAVEIQIELFECLKSKHISNFFVEFVERSIMEFSVLFVDFLEFFVELLECLEFCMEFLTHFVDFFEFILEFSE